MVRCAVGTNLGEVIWLVLFAVLVCKVEGRARTRKSPAAWLPWAHGLVQINQVRLSKLAGSRRQNPKTRNPRLKLEEVHGESGKILKVLQLRACYAGQLI